VISFRDFSYRYRGAAVSTLDRVDLTVRAGDFSLVVGSTGSGKSTLLRALHGTAGDISAELVAGVVTVNGADPRQRDPRRAAVVGVVHQDPQAGFAAGVVEDEIVHRLRIHGLPESAVRRRLEEVLDLMSVAHLRRRALGRLSAGEQQRVALAAVLAPSPRVLVLDEPTSALDPAAAEDVLAALLRLVHDVGVTVLAAEHRLERVVEYADQLVVVHRGRCRSGHPADVIADSPVVPPVVELGRLCGWTPLPLSVRDARQHAATLRAELADVAPPPQHGVAGVPGEAGDGLDARSIVVRHGTVTAVRGVRLRARPGEVVALMGRNGSGKSSLLHAVEGSVRRAAGSVRVGGRDPAQLPPREAAALVALVPQQPPGPLLRDTVGASCAFADRDAGAPAGTTRAVFESLCMVASVPEDTAPWVLSDGQRLSLLIAVRLAPRPRVILLDEPTRGLDYGAKARLGVLLAALAADGTAVVVATHDVEFVARTATGVVVLADGEVVSSGTTREVLAASPVFAPQVAKVLAPQDWLTTEEVAAGLASARH